MKRHKGFDPTTLEIYRALYTSVAEEMGLTLRRTAHSPNIKERRDYSCAVFDSRGRVVARPGSMGLATDVYGEGLRIPPVRLVRGGRVAEDVMRLLMANVRVERERRADFEAQIGSLKTGAARLLEVVARAGVEEAARY